MILDIISSTQQVNERDLHFPKYAKLAKPLKLIENPNLKSV